MNFKFKCGDSVNINHPFYPKHIIGVIVDYESAYVDEWNPMKYAVSIRIPGCDTQIIYIREDKLEKHV